MTVLTFRPPQPPQLQIDNLVLLFRMFETFNAIGSLMMPMASSTGFWALYCIWTKEGKPDRYPIPPDIPPMDGPHEIEFLRRLTVYATKLIGQAEALQINGQVPS